MKTIWTGMDLVLQFESRDVRLSTEETKEFEEWVLGRVKG